MCLEKQNGNEKVRMKKPSSQLKPVKGQTDRQRDKETERQRHRDTEAQRHRRTDRQGRRTDTQTDRAKIH